MTEHERTWLIRVGNDLVHAGWRRSWCGQDHPGPDQPTMQEPKGTWAEVTCGDCIAMRVATHLASREEP